MTAKKSLTHISEFGSSGTSPGNSHLRPPSPVVFISLSPRLLSIPTAAAYIASTNWLVEELCREGELPYLVVGKHRVIDIQDLDAWIAKQKKHTGQMPAPKVALNREAA